MLRWPRELFQQRLAELIDADNLDTQGWIEQVELVLDDAFDSDHPLEAFRSKGASIEDVPAWLSGTGTTGMSLRPYLTDLVETAGSFPYEIRRRPYRSQRVRPQHQDTTVSLPATVARFIQVVTDLDGRGYFEHSFQKDCVDDPRSLDPSVLIEEEIGAPDLWPLSVDRLVGDFDEFLDLIEVLGEFVAAPQARSLHPFGNCGWHHRDFNVRMGRDLYFWVINRLLDRSPIDLRLATSGEDRGRLVEVHGMARDDLVAATVEGADEKNRDAVEHAVSLFRRRGAAIEEKRSACMTLAGLLEDRRPLLKSRLFRRDEGALFQIANEFNIRHRNATQQGDYDPVFLDWIFWWYLGTIELTDRIVARESATTDEPPF